jgi:hypothetical protein
VTIRTSARMAGLAIVAAEATAVATRAAEPPTPAVATVLLVLQAVAVVWATDRRSSALVKVVVPALLMAVTVAALWTALAISAPAVVTGNGASLVAIVAAGLVVAASSRRGVRRMRLALTASAGSALLIFLAISSVLPSLPGFVSHNHPPIYTGAVRMVDPIVEFGVFVLLTLALGADILRMWIRTRRPAAQQPLPAYGAGPDEMVIEMAVDDSDR